MQTLALLLELLFLQTRGVAAVADLRLGSLRLVLRVDRPIDVFIKIEIDPRGRIWEVKVDR